MCSNHECPDLSTYFVVALNSLLKNYICTLYLLFLISICWLLYLIFHFTKKTKVKTFELIVLNQPESKNSYNSLIQVG